MRRVAFLFVLCGFELGCATMNPSAEFTRFGVADIRGDNKIIETYTQARNQPLDAKAAGVLALVDTLPDGIELSMGTLRVIEGAPFRLIGKFSLEGQVGTPIWFSDYKSTARKALCWPQVPLVWVSLFIWVIVPTDYFCWGDAFVDKQDLIDHAKIITATAGGNMVILSFIGTEKGTAYGLEGFVLEADPKLLNPDQLKLHAPNVPKTAKLETSPTITFQ